MKKCALLLCGGWEGHDPQGLGRLFGDILLDNDFEVYTEKDFGCFADPAYLSQFNLFVPCWSYLRGCTLEDAEAIHIADAVNAGMGIASCHGSMLDSFRENIIWQFLTGAQWVSHPSHPFYHSSPVGDPPEGIFNVDYAVKIEDKQSPITRGLKDFRICTEQYYLHTDPSIHVLASTEFLAHDGETAPYLASGSPIRMPIAYTRRWGKGRIFANAIGHNSDVFRHCSQALEIMRRGLLWAADALPDDI